MKPKAKDARKDQPARRRYPFTGYAKFLVATDDPDPVDTLASYDFVCTPPTDFDEITKSVRNHPKLNPRTAAVRQWCVDQRIYIMTALEWAAPHSFAIANAFKILRDHGQRQVMEQLLVMNFEDVSDVQTLFKEATGAEVCTKTIEIYEAYFWNCRQMTKLDWQRFLFDDKGAPRYCNAMELLSVMSIPRDEALVRLGFPCKSIKMNKADAVDDIFKMAAVMAKEGFYQRQPKMFAAGANMALAAYEIGRTTAIDVADVVNRLRGLKIAQVEDHVIHLSDLHEEHSTPGNVLTLPQLKKGGHDDADAS